ncbi:MAG: hypothetical protein VB050_17060 [Geobacteraceae bacterium]|nr:hypothetical protein [Geobacteraceae bacterium]
MLAWLKKYIPRPVKRAIRCFFRNAWESLLYKIARRHLDLRVIKHVVFVCKGNICRSAFAEKYLERKMTEEAVRIESCGLDVDQGGYSPPEAVRVAGDFGVDLASHHAKGLSSCNLQEADLIVAMEYGQYLRLRGLYPEKEACICLLREFAPWPTRIFCNIDDPFGLGDKVFRGCFRQMLKALEVLQVLFTERTI